MALSRLSCWLVAYHPLSATHNNKGCGGAASALVPDASLPIVLKLPLQREIAGRGGDMVLWRERVVPCSLHSCIHPVTQALGCIKCHALHVDRGFLSGRPFWVLKPKLALSLTQPLSHEAKSVLVLTGAEQRFAEHALLTCHSLLGNTLVQVQLYFKIGHCSGPQK